MYYSLIEAGGSCIVNHKMWCFNSMNGFRGTNLSQLLTKVFIKFMLNFSKGCNLNLSLQLPLRNVVIYMRKFIGEIGTLL